MKLKKNLFMLLSLVMALVLTVSVFGQLAPLSAQAKESDELKEQLEEAKSERKEIKQQMAALQADLDDNLDEISRIAAEKGVIDQEIGLINQDINLLGQEILTYGLLIADKQDELDEAQARLEQLTTTNKERIRAMEEDGTLSYWSVLFRANDFADLLDRLNMIEEIAAADRRRLNEMRQAREAVVQVQEELNAEKAELELARVEMEAQQAVLAEKRKEADKKLIELNERNEEFLKLLDAAEDADNELMKEIAKLQKEYDEAKRKEDAATAPPVSSGGGGSSNGTTTTKPPTSVTAGISWTMPCSYIKLSSPYGWRIHPVYGYPRFHAGVDLANVQGTPIYATRSGTVLFATFSSSAGYYVSINHGDGFSSIYMHMTHYVVSAGQKVKAGQVIGYMGSTGVSTGPHLHFGISYNGETQNPADYLNFH